MTAALTLHHYTGAQAAAAREELLDLHEQVYAGSGDPLAEREAFAPFLDHWALATGFTCAAVRTGAGHLAGYAYGAPLSAMSSWWQGLVPPLPSAEAAEDGRRTFALSELLLAQEWRGTGTARRLHDALLDGRREERVTLLAHAEHSGLLALYRRWGYQPVGECVPFAGAPRLAALLRPLR